jgi:hypothetical protein
LFRNRVLARASRPVEQISSRLCALPALFTLLSHQACGSGFIARSSCDVRRDSTVVFSCALATESLTDPYKYISALFARRRVCLIFLQGAVVLVTISRGAHSSMFANYSDS